MDAHISSFGTVEWALFIIWLSVIIWPIFYAIKNKTSIALSITVGLLLGYLIQVFWTIFARQGWVDVWLWNDFWMIPSRATEPSGWITFFSAGFLHSQFDATHVLGNILVISLVGIPLEQRLGMKRFAMIYLIGLFGGSFAWFLFNMESSTPALGASGAAFGLFGAYLAGWPKDEIPFPLILIRKWPVIYLALFYFAIEVLRAYSNYGLSRPSDVAHMAHLGGFVLSYVLLPIVAKGGPTPLGVEDGGPSVSPEIFARMRRMKESMKDLDKLEDPWTSGGFEIPKNLREAMQSLLESSDEPETRLAWMEHISDRAKCPVCGNKVGVIERFDGPHMQCSSEPDHFSWP